MGNIKSIMKAFTFTRNDHSPSDPEAEIDALYARAAALLQEAARMEHQVSHMHAHPPQGTVKAANVRPTTSTTRERCATCKTRVLHCSDCGRLASCHRGWCARVQPTRRQAFWVDGESGAKGVKGDGGARHGVRGPPGRLVRRYSAP